MKITQKGDEFVITDFNEIEAYRIARKIEEDGLRFYEGIMSEVDNEAVKDKIRILMSEERKHLRFFDDHLYKLDPNAADFEGDNILNYMDYGIFEPYKDIEGLGKKLDDVKMALKLGIKVEDNSVKFYQSALDRVASEGAKEGLKDIIEEEKKHKQLFESILEEV